MKAPHRSFCRFGSILALTFLLAPGTVLGVGAGSGDVYCNCNKQSYATPGGCMRGCKGNRLRCTGCFLSARASCPTLKHDAFRKLYNMWILGHSPLLFGITPSGHPRDAGLLTIAYSVINYFYAPLKPAQFRIVLHTDDNLGWARLERAPSARQKPLLHIHRDLFLLSPAFLVGSIGHELVHWDQMRRGLLQTSTNAEATAGFLELEASSWEIGVAGFRWPIRPNTLFDCYDEAEQADTRKTLECRKYQVRFGIEQAAINPVNLGRLEKWLSQNAWTKQVWLPENPKWKSYTAEPPSPCN